MRLISDISELDFRELGLVAGLEIHQQLDSKHKLFCRSPTALRDTDEACYEFFRYLRPARSEMGEVDAAALSEVAHVRRHVYRGYDTTCLVEGDEEPPTTLNEEALDIALLIAKMLNVHIIEQVHTMRKTVIDGSNTSGFQRTALIGTDGHIPSSQGEVGISVLCLEEEACQKVEDRGDEVVWSLDRLGIPLVEIGTKPDIKSPEHAREVARYIGMLLRSTGRVKRGIGTIRQDVNVSIRGGARIELKGVQELSLVEASVAYEAMRQVNLLRIRDELVRRGAHVGETRDITPLLQSTKSRVIRRALERGGVVYACTLYGFGGLVGAQIQPNRRLGSELSDYAKKAGVGGIFHTDELPAYGITEDEVDAIMREMGASSDDCVVLVADEEGRARAAMEQVVMRAHMCLEGVPNETRRALADGTSAYMRPLPGSARMYPETDVPPVVIDSARIEAIEIPELLDQKVERISREYGIARDVAHHIVDSDMAALFESLVEGGAPPSLAAGTLTSTLTELRREGVPVHALTPKHIHDALMLCAKGELAKEGIPEVLSEMARNPQLGARDAMKRCGLSGVDMGEVQRLIERVVEERVDFVRERGMGAVGPLMGVVMGELRGKVDGRRVSAMLSEKIRQTLDEA